MRRRYEGFTLIEMLIVMGILIVLMVIGVAAGRFAINRANDVAHQNAADQIYQGLQAYYTDNRKYPTLVEIGSANDPVAGLIGEPGSDDGLLSNYIDSGAFRGGTEATFVYIVGDLNQSVLVCVSLGGIDDVSARGYYCNGNGFGDDNITVPVSGNDVIAKEILPTDTAYAAINGTDANNSDWYGKSWMAAPVVP